MEAITSFWGEHRFLSNFFPALVIYDGVEYPTVENAYQAAKTMNTAARIKFEDIYAAEAKRLGKTLKLREDWDEVRYDIMYDLVNQKFRNPELQKKLKYTGNREIVEGNRWGDTFWGCIEVEGDWVGKNLLGRILMEIRAAL